MKKHRELSRGKNIFQMLEATLPSLFMDDTSSPVVDGQYQRMLQYRIEVTGLREEITSLPEAVEKINHIATLVGVSNFHKEAFHSSKPSKIRRKVSSILEDIRSPALLEILEANLGSQRAFEIFEDLERGFRDPSSPTLTATELAEEVGGVLREHGLSTATSKSGLWVHTLKRIGEAANFKVNAEHSVRDTFK